MARFKVLQPPTENNVYPLKVTKTKIIRRQRNVFFILALIELFIIIIIGLSNG